MRGGQHRRTITFTALGGGEGTSGIRHALPERFKEGNENFSSCMTAGRGEAENGREFSQDRR